MTPFYDPLISKVIVHAPTREEAIQKSIDFLSKVDIEGLKTNIPLFNNFLKSEEFHYRRLFYISFTNLERKTKGGNNKMTELKATMAGTVFTVNAAVGEEVTAGQVIIVLESMKMEIPIEAETAGKVALLMYKSAISLTKKTF